MDTTLAVRRPSSYNSRQGPVSGPTRGRSCSLRVRPLPETPTHELASVAPLPLALALPLPRPRVRGRPWTSTGPAAKSRPQQQQTQQHAYTGHQSSRRNISYEPNRSPGRTDAGLLWPAAPALLEAAEAANSMDSDRRTRARHSFRRGISKPDNIVPLETILESAVVPLVCPRACRVRVRSRSTEPVGGEGSSVSALYPSQSFSTPARGPVSARRVDGLVSTSTSTSSTSTSTATSTASSTSSATSIWSSASTTRPLRPIITPTALSALLNTLTCWRFRTFYADFLLSKPCSSNSNEDSSAATTPPAPLPDDVLRAMDWASTHSELETHCLQREKGYRCLAAPLADLVRGGGRARQRERKVYYTVRDAAAMAGIPFRVARRAVAACAFWLGRECEGQRECRRMLTAGRLAARKDWEALARIVLEDAEDLDLDWVGDVFGAGAGASTGPGPGPGMRGVVEMRRAVESCEERYFSYLAYREDWQGTKRCCERWLGRFAKRLRLGRNNRMAMGMSLSGKRNVEWSLSQAERHSMDGKEELVREMHERYRRDGVREARVAVQRFSID